MTMDASSTVRVLVGTTEGPVDILNIVREKNPPLRRSVAYIGSRSDRADISRGYEAFVSRNHGLIEPAFGTGPYRIDLSGRIDSGSSWQLGFFVAHALEAAHRLANGPAGSEAWCEAVVWTSGTVGGADLAVGGVGFLARKLNLSLERLRHEAQPGRRIVVAFPAANAGDMDADLRRALAAMGAGVMDLDTVRPLLWELALPPVTLEVAAADRVWNGSPFRSLEPFEASHRDIFFGRGRAREEAMERLRRAAARGTAFLLIHGRSGAGKSSLVRAGLVGDIKAQVADTEVWLDCLVIPQAAEGSPLKALADALAACLPGVDAARDGLSLEDRLRRSNADDIDTFRAAIAAAGKGRSCRLLLVIDQLEELLLWTREQADEHAEAEREAFAEAVAALSRSGAAWTIATLRSDLLGALEDSPALSRLATDDHLHRLERPSRMELREIILRPAGAARLTFQGADPSGEPFADVLIAAADRAPDSLPLLQVMLSSLFDIEGNTRSLTYAAYVRLGGLEATIGRRAEGEVDALVKDGVPQQDIEQVILSLGRHDRELGAVTGRWAPIPHTDGARAGAHENQVRVLDALRKARLVVFDETGRARVAHDAVLTHWPRVKALFDLDRRDLDLRDLVETRADEWQRENHDPAFLVAPGRRLNEVAELANANHVLLSQPTRQFIAASVRAANQAAEKRRRRTRRNYVILGTAVAVFFSLSVAVAMLWQDQRNTSDNLKGALLTARQETIKAIIGEAQTYAANGKYGAATISALRAIDAADASAESLPPDLFDTLYHSIVNLRERTILRDKRGMMRFAAFSPDASYIITSSEQKSGSDIFQLWDIKTDRLVQEFAVNEGVMAGENKFVFSPDGSQLLALSRTGGAILFEISPTGMRLRGVVPERATFASFSDDGEFMITASSNVGEVLVHVRDIKTLEQRRTYVVEDGVADAARSAAGIRTRTRQDVVVYAEVTGVTPFAITKKGELVIFDARAPLNASGSGVEIRYPTRRSMTGSGCAIDSWNGLLTGGPPVSRYDLYWTCLFDWNRFSRDTGMIAAVKYPSLSDFTGGIYTRAATRVDNDEIALSEGGLIYLFGNGELKRVLSGHSEPVRYMSFGRLNRLADSRLFVSASIDRSAKVWSDLLNDPIAILEGHDDEVTSADLAPDGGSIVTTSADGTARIWALWPRIVEWTSPDDRSKPCRQAIDEEEEAIIANGSYQVKNRSSGSKLRTINHPYALFTASCLSPSGKYLILGTNRGTLDIWKTSSWEKITTINLSALARDGRGVLALAMSEDEKSYVVSFSRERYLTRENIFESLFKEPGSQRGVVKLKWPVIESDQQLISLARMLAPRDGHAEEATYGRTEIGPASPRIPAVFHK